MNTQLTSIAARLKAYRLNAESPNLKAMVNEIYKLTFPNKFYEEIWDEQILLGLQDVISDHPPKQDVYGAQLNFIRERTELVVAANDIFAAVLFRSKEEMSAELSRAANQLKMALSLIPQVTDALRKIKESSSLPWEKLAAVVDEFSRLVPSMAESFKKRFEAVKAHLEIGAASALLVTEQQRTGTVLQVRTLLQPGSGEVKHAVTVQDTFRAAVSGGHGALYSRGWLGTNQDVVFSTENTNVTYSGSSIALAAAMAMYSSGRGWRFDPYTAFTGDINIIDGQWRVLRVNGIPEKLSAALRSGIRRVVLPRQNETDVPQHCRRLDLVLVDDLSQVLSRLVLPQDSAPTDTLQQRKVSLVNVHCSAKGWQVSTPRGIQNGLQFTIAPATADELRINVYDSGAHTPKQHQQSDFQELLDRLNRLDTPETPLQSVQQTFTISDTALRQQIKEQFEAVRPSQSKTEQYCDYTFIFENGKEKLVVKQYSSGKLQLQGHAGPLYRKALDIIIPRYNLRYPGATLNVANYLKSATNQSSPAPLQEAAQDAIAFPHIGTDESGKGDYFGPLVVAGVWVDESLQSKLTQLGVRDSKQLSDRRCQELASSIREICGGRYQVIEISPEKYNQLHGQLLREKRNLNHLLAWGHARAIESLLGRQNCNQAIADQFGDEKYIASKLMEKGKALNLLQTPKAERFIAVAAASVLARDHFLSRLNQLGKEAGLDLPKGASQDVIEAAKQIVQKGGADSLRKFAKLHFKTTISVLGKH